MRIDSRRRLARLALAWTCVLPTAAWAQVFKCVDQSGHTTYQQTPCPPSATGGRVELNIDNGSTRDLVDDDPAWEAAVRDKNVLVGMPRRFVRRALGTPRETRPGRSGEDAGEVWSYTQGEQVLRIGFRNGAVAWMRTGALVAQNEASPDDEATQRILRRRSVAEGDDCTQFGALLGPPDQSEDLKTTANQTLRYSWEPAAGDPFARTVITCTDGRVTNIERGGAR